jgi:hypothetical protein
MLGLEGPQINSAQSRTGAGITNMDTIHRSVAVIKPKQPFLDWLNALPDNDQPFTSAELQTDCTVLLLPEFGNDLQAQKFIKKIHADIFERELDAFFTDPDYWPPKRDYKTFLEWFDIEHHSEVFDTVDKEIIKERWE